MRLSGNVPNIRHVVERRDMLAGTGNRDAVQQFEEVEIERVQNRLAVRSSGGSFDQLLNAAWALRNISSMLVLVFSFSIRISDCTFIGQGQLVAQIVETVVDGGGRQHQHLGFDAGPDDLVHQFLVTGFLLLEGVVVAEIMRFIDDDQIVIAPVHPVQRNAVGCAQRYATNRYGTEHHS